MDTNKIASSLTKFGLFSELSPNQIHQIAKDSVYEAILRGNVLFNRGDTAKGIFLLLEGQVKLAVTSPQGSVRTIGVVSAGESFGEAVIFLDRTSFPIAAEAIEDTKVLMVPKHVIFNLLDTDNTFARNMLAGLSMRNHQLVQDIENITLNTAGKRLIDYILQIAETASDGKTAVLPMSKTNIASLLNLTPETFSRAMQKLHKLNLIEVSGKEITVFDKDELRAHSQTL